eukprot:scaffold56229_cov59-Phaeocystis_antarctica.AAC.5
MGHQPWTAMGHQLPRCAAQTHKAHRRAHPRTPAHTRAGPAHWAGSLHTTPRALEARCAPDAPHAPPPPLARSVCGVAGPRPAGSRPAAPVLGDREGRRDRHRPADRPVQLHAARREGATRPPQQLTRAAVPSQSVQEWSQVLSNAVSTSTRLSNAVRVYSTIRVSKPSAEARLRRAT